MASGYWLPASQRRAALKIMKKNKIIKKNFNHPIIRIWSLVIVGLCIVGYADLSFAVQQTALIPLEDFFKNPDRTSFEISPDGKRIAYLRSWQNRLNVYVQKVDDDKPVRVTHSKNRDIMWFGWANDRRIAYIQDKEGDENWHAYAVDIDGANFLALTPFAGVTVRLVDGLEEDDNHALIALNRRDKSIFDVYRLNVSTAELKLVAENPGNITRWVTDNEGKLRVAVATDGANKTLLYRKTESERFKTIITTDFKSSIWPLFFTFDNRFLYVSSNFDRNTRAIYKYDIENGRHLELIYEHPEVDVYRLMRSKKRKVITGAAYITSKYQFYFFDEKRKKLQDMLEEKLPGYEVIVSNHSKDETKMVIRTYSDRSLGAYYYYDNLQKELKKIADVSPWIDENDMAEMQPIQYLSRDGLTIHGYLTLPKGMAPRNLPLVVNPHGGPWARNRWTFDSQAQFLANRGLAVLQVNYRGSTGYGKAFWQAGFKEWGKKMLNDVTDGVHWLIKEGIADPKRVGIYGASFGGYTALAGLAFTPDLYVCGIDYVGISNIFTWLNSIPAYWEPQRQMFYEMVGDPEKDQKLLRAASPLFHADKIKVPLLVAQGANDPRVKKAESDQIVEAVKKHGIEVQYMVKDNEGHGFRNEENRFEFYRAMEAFFAKHLGSKKKSQQ
jgi:dipeptidyl aminopeptidase/acylaminoacyl peptidase